MCCCTGPVVLGPRNARLADSANHRPRQSEMVESGVKPGGGVVNVRRVVGGGGEREVKCCCFAKVSVTLSSSRVLHELT